jgi:ATP-dependent RNA helicase SUPV3L1/SUV3
MASTSAGSAPLVVAELGPTNTGKTHRAVERMLEHTSGMMGLPLRLLAREVYDRVTARVGEARVALVTGEEKRIPPHPAYWICTVEAMPDVPVDFLAVDEIQLAAHRERGHVFTDRLLHWRGMRETWFLGADTMRPLAQSLLPGASLRRSTRLSQLHHFGRRSLKSLPPRTAVVAFSVDRVYELAESLRRLRGGVAVVLGALSPRTRNAQVAMYQSGEVQYLVATDAIGMGLNLDLDRVAFAQLSKYDGFEQRFLMPDELAQIAGRAGRHVNDGAFGTLNGVPELSPQTASAIEAHRFPPVRRLVWRSRSLDFANPEALLDSLSAAPDRPEFARVERADDFDALRDLSHRPQVHAAARGPKEVALLWEVCQVPDFRKRLFGEHVALLEEVFLQLVSGGQLSADWLQKKVRPLEDVGGDIQTLMDRLAAIRIWTYVSQRISWVPDAEAWQARTRQAEDALGDALHARLVERFVERAARRTPRRILRRTDAQKAVAEGPFAALGQLAGALQEAEGTALSEEQYVQGVVDADASAFELDGAGRLTFDGEPLARLVRGTDRRAPQVALLEPELWTGGARRQLERRVAALARDLVAQALGGFPAESMARTDASPQVRGLAYQLGEGLGVVRKGAVIEQWRALPSEARLSLQRQGVREGRRFLYVTGALSLEALERRAVLTALAEGHTLPVGVPREPLLQLPGWDRREAERFGYEAVGPVWMRVDVLERLAEALGQSRGGAKVAALCSELGLEAGPRQKVLQALADGDHAQRPSRRRKRRPGHGGRGPGPRREGSAGRSAPSRGETGGKGGPADP